MHEAAPKQWQCGPKRAAASASGCCARWHFGVGRPFARFITFFVALYFMIRRGPERAASRTYLERVLGHRVGLWEVYQHFLWFSTVTLDRLYLMADHFKRFEVRIFGIEQLDEAVAGGRGTLLLSAHLGSFDALRVLSTRSPDIPIRILLDVGQNAGLSDLLNALNPRLAETIIDARRTGPELVLEMQKALEINAVVSTLADRLRPGNPVVTVELPR